MKKAAEGAGGSLASRIVRAPKLAFAADSRARVKEWQAEIAKSPAGKALAKIKAASPKTLAMMEGLADGSPYLWGLIADVPARWVSLLEAEPEVRLAALLAGILKAAGEWDDDAAAMRALRLMKAEASLLIAVADIGGVWDVPKVIHALTEVADAAVAAAVRYLLRRAREGSGGKAKRVAQPELNSGYIVLALGKMGAHELNYSSDIDLIVFYEPEAAPESDAGPTAYFVRITRGLVKLLQERTADGYVFRVDLRLRPDPSSTQIAVSVPAALDYYERSGQNWERAAMIKARPCAGDIAAGEAMLKNLAPFVWRKHLDYVAIADVHAMKQQIHVYRGHGDIAVEGHNIKLGRGGIREIEFFVQTQQLIAGGRHLGLRGRQTLAMLAELTREKWIKEEAQADLEAAYKFLREVEHRLQMVADEQTHTLPQDSDDLDRFSKFLGYAGRTAFAQALLHHLNNVQRHYAALFEAMPSAPGASRELKTDTNNPAANADYFAEHGFAKPAETSATVAHWFSGRYRSLKGELARSHLADLIPQFVEHAVRSESADATFAALDRFLEALHGGAQLYSLLRQNRDLVALLITILATAPRLADILAQQPEAMDGVMEPAFFGALPDAAQLEKALQATFGQSDTFEDFLDRARVFGREHMFLIGVRVISGTVTAAQAGEAFAQLADVLIRAMLTAATNKFESEYGRLRKQQVALLALGKLGGNEMTAGSDLDLIVMYDFDAEHPESNGTRKLTGGQYFARLTQRIVNSLTVPTNYGRLYEVDMRLRPSGGSGPLATSLMAFEDYQANEAWTWEQMALTRARVLAAPPAFAAKIEKLIRTVLCRSRTPLEIAADVFEMRGAIEVERGEADRWDIKNAAGGLLDIEFIAQYLQLVHAAQAPEILDVNTARVLEKATRLGLLKTEDAEILRPAVRLYHDLTQILRLCLSAPLDPKKVGAGLTRLLTRAADVPNFATLDALLSDTQAEVRACFNRMLGPAESE